MQLTIKLVLACPQEVYMLKPQCTGNNYKSLWRKYNISTLYCISFYVSLAYKVNSSHNGRVNLCNRTHALIVRRVLNHMPHCSAVAQQCCCMLCVKHAEMFMFADVTWCVEGAIELKKSSFSSFWDLSHGILSSKLGLPIFQLLQVTS